MRKITLGPVLVFVSLLGLALMLSIVTTSIFFGELPLGDFRGVTLVAIGFIFLYVYAIILHRICLHYMPLEEGDVEEGSRQEFAYHVYLLFYLILFYSLTRSLALPVPFTRLIYLALGAQLGNESYPAGVILDPPLTEVGDNSIIGHDAVLYSHAIEGNHLSHAKIIIGNNATIGAKAILMSGVTVGDGAIVAAGAVVLKGTEISADEVWGGNPARLLRTGKKTIHPS